MFTLLSYGCYKVLNLDGIRFYADLIGLYGLGRLDKELKRASSGHIKHFVLWAMRYSCLGSEKFEKEQQRAVTTNCIDRPGTRKFHTMSWCFGYLNLGASIISMRVWAPFYIICLQ